MKKIVLLVTLLCSVWGFQSCSLDNFDEPNASLSGALVDSETGETVQTQYKDGAKIRLYEFYNNEWTTQPVDFFATQDGSFTNNIVFAGKYKIKAEGPFETPEETEMEIAGHKDLQIKVVPFLRVESGANASGTSVNFTAKISRTSSTRQIKTLEFFCASTPYVDKSTFVKKKTIDLSAMADSEILSKTFSATVEGLTSGKTYYARVGVLTQNAANQYNYGKIVEIKIP